MNTGKKKWIIPYEITALMKIEIESDDIDDAIYRADKLVERMLDSIILKKASITDIQVLEDKVKESEE